MIGVRADGRKELIALAEEALLEQSGAVSSQHFGRNNRQPIAADAHRSPRGS